MARMDPLFAECDTRARALGVRIDTVNPQLGRDLWWIVPGSNWATTRPGRTLEQIKEDLDALEKTA